MIDEADIEKALDWMRDNADEAALAIANRIYLEEYRKTMKSLCMQKHLDKAVNAQEREAYADDEYIKILSAIKEAVHEAERWQFMYKAADAKIKAWQTFSANARPRV